MQRPKNEPLKSSHPRCVSVGLRLFPTAGVFHHCGALALRARPAQRFVFGTPSGGGITAVSHGAPVPTHHVLRTWHCISALLAHPWLSAAGCNRTIGRARVPSFACHPPSDGPGLIDPCPWLCAQVSLRERAKRPTACTFPLGLSAGAAHRPPYLLSRAEPHGRQLVAQGPPVASLPTTGDPGPQIAPGGSLRLVPVSECEGAEG